MSLEMLMSNLKHDPDRPRLLGVDTASWLKKPVQIPVRGAIVEITVCLPRLPVRREERV